MYKRGDVMCGACLRRMIGFFVLLYVTPLAAATTAAVFAKYPNHYFVETGSWYGAGIQEALNSGGFREIHSVELSTFHHQHCKKRFYGQRNVHLWHGDSARQLPGILSHIDAPATFWLDAHYSQGDTAMGETKTALTQELEAIGRHHIRTHTILIDDVRLFGTSEFDYLPLHTVVAMLYSINPDYQITFEDGFQKNDVLVASCHAITAKRK